MHGAKITQIYIRSQVTKFWSSWCFPTVGVPLSGGCGAGGCVYQGAAGLPETLPMRSPGTQPSRLSSDQNGTHGWVSMCPRCQNEGSSFTEGWTLLISEKKVEIGKDTTQIRQNFERRMPPTIAGKNPQIINENELERNRPKKFPVKPALWVGIL